MRSLSMAASRSVFRLLLPRHPPSVTHPRSTLSTLQVSGHPLRITVIHADTRCGSATPSPAMFYSLPMSIYANNDTGHELHGVLLLNQCTLPRTLADVWILSNFCIMLCFMSCPQHHDSCQQLSIASTAARCGVPHLEETCSTGCEGLASPVFCCLFFANRLPKSLG